ncbi:MAG: glycosyl hydrolase [Saprospiraceae bacterium]|nr:glycosyl hydrolase [Saprospiraceae bacterium]
MSIFKNLYSLILILMVMPLSAQNPVEPTTPDGRRLAHAWRTSPETEKEAGAWKFTNIGPTIMSGRITDLDVNPANGREFYIAYASGGLWYTQNNGTSFTPVFDHEAVMTIGDIAVHWPTHTIYVGTGECNSSRSSYAGNGVYKSTDKGKTWEHLGLDETHHISRVWIHPANPKKVIVAALGHLYSSNVERGIYLSEDGGTSWQQPLYVGENTGAVDLMADPSNPEILYCAVWYRSRLAWNFEGSGASSTIYKSSDGGITWSDIAKPESGFPRSLGTGRIGLALARRGDLTHLFAIVDNQESRELKKEETEGLKKDAFKTMDMTAFEKISEESLATYLKDNSFPEKYSAKDVIKMIKEGKVSISSLAEYLEDANSSLTNPEVKGAELYTSTDDGQTWTKTHEAYIDGLYYTYGYYFGQVRARYDNPNELYILGVPLLKSNDGGKMWKSIDGDNMHGDHHALWLHPTQAGTLYNGNDGGLNISYDDGKTWIKCNMPAVGQFYSIQTDNEDVYNVYGGLQDNGVWMGKHSYNYSTSWQSNGVYPYKLLLGGDGMQVQVDRSDNQTVYTGFQFGNYYRIDKRTGKRKFITPKHELGERPYRFNWQTPILLSPHNQDILYMGANKLLRSMDRGDNFKEMSGDLTNGGKPGNVPYGTLTALDESALRFGLIYTGSDDGAVYGTLDGGYSWKNIGDGLPKHFWVSSIKASTHKESRVYLSLNGYRWDHFKPYVYVSNDYGNTWTSLANGLPDEPVNVVIEDDTDSTMIYVGTDHGVYFSPDGGSTYQRLDASMPQVPVHDLKIQSREGHLIAGTHGRSLYLMDLKALRKLKDAKKEGLYVMEVDELKYNKSWGVKRNAYTDPDTPLVKLTLYSDMPGTADVIFSTADGLELQTSTLILKPGMAAYEYSPMVSAQAAKSYLSKLEKPEGKKSTLKPTGTGRYYPVAGKYEIKIIHGKLSTKTKLTIKEAKK